MKWYGYPLLIAAIFATGYGVAERDEIYAWFNKNSKPAVERKQTSSEPNTQLQNRLKQLEVKVEISENYTLPELQRELAGNYAQLQREVAELRKNLEKPKNYDEEIDSMRKEIDNMGRDIGQLNAEKPKNYDGEIDSMRRKIVGLKEYLKDFEINIEASNIISAEEVGQVKGWATRYNPDGSKKIYYTTDLKPGTPAYYEVFIKNTGPSDDYFDVESLWIPDDATTDFEPVRLKIKKGEEKTIKFKITSTTPRLSFDPCITVKSGKLTKSKETVYGTGDY